MRRFLVCGVIAVLAMVNAGPLAQARDQIRIVGSSTVFPFSSYVAEEFGATTDYPTPIVESTGSGGGHKLFSEGVGLNRPDITNSSRRMKLSEFERNQENGVKEIIECRFGYDGIAIAHHIDNEPVNFTLEEITKAVAAKVPQNGELVNNPYTHWNQINPNLPNQEILIYGPPTTSGTRDAFEELVMEAVWEDMGYPEPYAQIRQDGLYIPSGEQDNLIVQKLIQDAQAFGIFGYSFLMENEDRLQSASVNGVKPTPETISNDEYPVSRSLFFYVKAAHLGQVPGLGEFVDLFLSEKMIGGRGFLKRIGLVPLSREQRDALRKQWENRVLLKKEDLQ